jgi:hypothetical protein
MPTTYKGTLTGFSGSWMSGIGQLIFSDRPAVMCENAQTVRSLQACYGDVIDKGHTASIKSPREIVYSVDDVGLLLGFTPVDEWTGPEIPPEGIEEEWQG